jgi:hypothetical protein
MQLKTLRFVVAKHRRIADPMFVIGQLRFSLIRGAAM